MSKSDSELFSDDEYVDTSGVSIDETQHQSESGSDDVSYETTSDNENADEEQENTGNVHETSGASESREEQHEDEKNQSTDDDETSDEGNTDNEPDESIIGRRPRSGKKRVAVIEDSEDESDVELEYERRALSPSTRRSIGVFVASSSEESDIEEEEDENVEEQEDENNDEEEQDSSYEHGNENATISPKDVTNKSLKELQNKRETMYKPRLSEFETSIKEKISSTIAPVNENEPDVTVISDSEDESVQEISKKSDDVLEISSSFENSGTERRETLQPKLNAMLSKKPETSTPKAPTVKTAISRSMYEYECRELDNLRRKREILENFVQNSSALPDKGAKLAVQLLYIKEHIRQKESKLEGLEINESSKSSVLLNSIEEVKEPSIKPIQETNWNELNNLVQPKYTGKQGMKTFENQKALTEKRLNDIHGSLNTQPAEDVLHPTPHAINIELMDHQKHGLAWMIWREKSKPRGGILADDMGLGKTLSLISLIVEKMDTDENDEQQEETDSDDEENDNGWKGKGRRTHYNGGTLVVCPASLLGQWENEVRSRVKRNTLSLYIHHGPGREPKAKYLAREDLVVTTYSIVSVEHKANAALFGVKWNRIILDEAHIIRNHKTNGSEACAALRGKYRWALTGTPICNKEMDIYALLRFLRVTPFDDLPTYKRWLEDKRGGGGPRIHALMKTMMLRRTKEMLRAKEELTLPEKYVHDIDVQLNQNEKNVYSKVLAYSRTLFTEYLAQRKDTPYGHYETNASGNSNVPNAKFAKLHDKFAAVHGTVQVHQILTLLLRLRQICDHPGLIQAMITSGEDLEHSGNNDSHSSLHEIDLIKQLETLNINNSNDDIDDEVATRFSAKLMSTHNPIFNLANPSSKIKAVMKYYIEEVKETGEKAVFVSQWTSVLKLFEPHLTKAGVKFVSLTGEVPVKLRGDIIEKFNRCNSNAPKIMLLSLTAGGVGLNLSVANHLFMIDCHWNPQLENQAQDRVYRVGQKREVHLYKFITSDSIEVRIKALQQKKLELANAVLTGAKNIGSKLTIQDLRSLFEV